MIKQTLRCVSVILFLASLVSILTVIVDVYVYYAYPDVSEYLGIAVIVYVLVSIFLITTALNMWKGEKIGTGLYSKAIIGLLLSLWLLNAAYVGLNQGSDQVELTFTPGEPLNDIPLDTTKYLDQALELQCRDICNSVPDATQYFVYVSGRDDGNVCECYSSNDSLLRMVPMD